MIVITGASGALGNYLVNSLKKNHEIIGTYFSHAPEQTDKNISYYKVDVSDSKSIESFYKSISAKLNNVIFINMAGISIDALGHKMSEESWDRVVDINLKGAFLMSRVLIPIMRTQGYGRIIFTSSIVGQTGIAGTCAYSTSKAGLFGLARTIAAENSTKNITVNTLALGYFNLGIINTIKLEIQDQIKEKIPMKRFGDPAVIEAAVRFLIDCDYMTGAVLNINGGFLY